MVSTSSILEELGLDQPIQIQQVKSINQRSMSNEELPKPLPDGYSPIPEPSPLALPLSPMLSSQGTVHTQLEPESPSLETPSLRLMSVPQEPTPRSPQMLWEMLHLELKPLPLTLQKEVTSTGLKPDSIPHSDSSQPRILQKEPISTSPMQELKLKPILHSQDLPSVTTSQGTLPQVKLSLPMDLGR